MIEAQFCSDEFAANCIAEGFPLPTIVWYRTLSYGLITRFTGTGALVLNMRTINVTNEATTLYRIESLFQINATDPNVPCFNFTLTCMAFNSLGNTTRSAEQNGEQESH